MKYRTVYNRLRRIEGQIRGIEEMLDKGREISQILIQLEAAKSSLSSTIASLLGEMLSVDSEEKVVLSKAETELILRSIKNN